MFEDAVTPPAEDPKPVKYQPPDWERAIEGFLVEKQSRSGSLRTRGEYLKALRAFFGVVDKLPPDVTAQDVFGFAYGIGPSGKEPSASTISFRITVLSSLFRFLQRMDLLIVNPCDRVQRPHVEPPTPRGLDVDEIKRLLAAIPRTPAGTRDRAIVMFAIFTGRRRSELLNLTAGDLSRNGAVFYSYRGKGGRVKTRELPEPVFRAILEGLRANGRELEGMDEGERLFDVSIPGFSLNFHRYLRNAGLEEAGVHLLRHSAAKLRRAAGESLEDVSSFLDHSNLAITSTYLKRLEGTDDAGWQGIAALLAA